MRTYVGRRSGIAEVWVEENGYRRDLPMRLNLRNHSPTGFEWGYGGSGPAQLALAILVDHFTQDRGDGVPLTNTEAALALYQPFKFKVVAGLPKDEWRLTSAEVETALEEIRAERRKETAT